jgi:hypothetical protein
LKVFQIIFSTIKKDFMGCLRGYFKKCGTPLHREILGLILDQAQSHVNKFCDNGPERESMSNKMNSCCESLS